MNRLVALMLFLPLSCFAVDGVYEINQPCVASGCFSGDDPGWPVVLVQPGSYRLTGNLNVSEADDAINVTAIEVNSDGVSLDLNGFSIIGPKLTEKVGTGVGIYSFGAGTSIANGHVTGMGDRGINCGEGCRIDGVSSTYNGTVGFQMAGSNLVINSVSRLNSLAGVVSSGVVKNCVISNNGGTGVFANPLSIIEGSQIVSNTANGVECDGCSLIGNVISNNTAKGVVFIGNASFGGNQINGNVGGDTNVAMFHTAPNNCNGAACP